MIRLMIVVVCMAVLMPGWAWALKPVKNAQVVDSNGKLVGTIIGLEGTIPYVILRVLGNQDISVGLTRDGIQTQDTLLFEAADCSTAPLIMWGETPAHALFPVVVANKALHLYVADFTVDALSVVIRAEGDGITCNPVGPISRLTVPTTFVDLSARFTPPFSVSSK